MKIQACPAASGSALAACSPAGTWLRRAQPCPSAQRARVSCCNCGAPSRLTCMSAVPSPPNSASAIVLVRSCESSWMKAHFRCLPAPPLSRRSSPTTVSDAWAARGNIERSGRWVSLTRLCLAVCRVCRRAAEFNFRPSHLKIWPNSSNNNRDSEMPR